MTAAAFPARRWRRRAHRWWRAMRDDIDDQAAVAVIAGTAFILAALVAALVWGLAGSQAVTVLGLMWLVFDRTRLWERADQAADDADLARQQADKARADAAAAVAELRVVRDHLEGREPEQTGRHAHKEVA